MRPYIVNRNWSGYVFEILFVRCADAYSSGRYWF